MKLLYPALIGLAGGIAGTLIYAWIQRADHRNNPAEKILAITASALVPAGLFLKYGMSPIALVYSILALVLTGVSVFDLRTKTIPLWITVPGSIVGIAVSMFTGNSNLRNSVTGMFLGAAILLFTTLVEAIRKKDVGGGDWKLAAMIGSFLGPRRIVTAMLLGGLAGLAAGIVMALRPGSAKPSALGPYLSAGAIATMFWN